MRDPILCKWLPELTWRAGLSDRAAERLLELPQNGGMDPGWFQIFKYGAAVQRLDEALFRRLLEFLVESGNRPALCTGLDLHWVYYLHGEDRPALPAELSARLLLHDALFEAEDGFQYDQMSGYQWTRVASALLDHHPEYGVEMAARIVSSYGEPGTIVGGWEPPAAEVLARLVREQPAPVWPMLLHQLGPPVTRPAFSLTRWLRGETLSFGRGRPGMLGTAPRDLIWAWVDEDVEKRAWFLASFVPPTLAPEADGSSLVRELLRRYGSREDVRRNLSANFSTEGWMGDESVHVEAKRQEFLAVREHETDPQVLLWLNEYCQYLAERAESARLREERYDD